MTQKCPGAGWKALCIVLAALSPHARAAEAEPAKAPLTAEERQQCLAQLTEINQGVTAHNQRVEDIKALEAEVDALRAELDKEEAGLDRRNNAVMQAFNAKVRKNNELVDRHEKLVAEAKAASADNKQRAAQFRETCDNRPAPPPPSQPVQATPADRASCGSVAAYKDVQRSIEATFAEMRADEKARQGEVERLAQKRAKELGWSKDRQGKVWLQILGSPGFMAFEREKAPHVQELMRVMGSKPKNGQEECQLVQRIAVVMPAIKAINTRQYAFMAEQIRVTK